MNNKLAENHIILGVGANLAGDFGCPKAACGTALEKLAKAGVEITGRSPWYESAPVPISDQPWFVNGVVTVSTDLAPTALLQLMLNIEAQMGRLRSVANAARTIDLDLLSFAGMVSKDGEWPILPHPRLHQRAFVVLPLADLLPHWSHPKTGQSVANMKANLPPDQEIRPIPKTNDLHGTEWCECPRI